MKKLVSFALILALATVAACGKKKAPANPTNTATESAAPAGGATDSNAEKSTTAPDSADDKQPMGADPCEGGE